MGLYHWYYVNYAKTGYMQGLNRLWTRQDKFDYAWSEFESIGEQNVLNQELLWNHPNPDDTFWLYPKICRIQVY